MGVTHIEAIIRNPGDRARTWRGRFLVDTGAFDSLVPRDALAGIGLTPTGRRTYELADGNEITMGTTTGEIEFMDETVGGTIIFGEPGTEPILGVTALESAGIQVDPQNQTLKKLPAVRLKKLTPRRRPLAQALAASRLRP